MFKLRLLPLGLLSLFMVLVLAVGLMFSTPSMRLSLEHPTSLNHGWVYVNDTEQTNLAQLPVRLEIDGNQPYVIETILGDDFNKSQHILIRTSLSNLSVMLDDQLLYDKQFEDEIGYASIWHIITIPNHSENKTLRLTFDTPYDSMRGIINEVEYGSTNALYTEIFRDYGFRFVMGLSSLLVGVLMLMTSLFMLKKDNRYHAYLGLFGILVSTWLLSESRLLQFFIGNTNVLKSLSYMSLAFLPVPLAVYIKNILVKDYKKFFDVIIMLFSLNFIIITILHFTQTLSFFQTVIGSITLIVLTLGVTWIILVIHYLRYREQKMLKMVLLMLFTGVFIGAEVLFFSLSAFNRTADFAAIALSLMLILVFIFFIRFSFINYRGNLERHLYEKIATTDQLTGAYSRFAFFSTIKDLQTQDSLNNTSLIYFDLDGLKIINDQFGHAHGDEAITKAFQIISDSFGDYGLIYRMGGDEFVCVAHDVDANTYQETLQKFHTLTQSIEQVTNYSFNISTGFAQFDAALDKTLTDTLKRSDDKMYDNKRANKQKPSLTK